MTDLTIKSMVDQIVSYQKKMGYDYSAMTEKEKMQALSDYTTALTVEVGELLTEMPWKPWRTIESQKRNQRKAALEYVDCIFFLVNMGSCMDLTVADVEAAFDTKLKANLARIKSGYSAKRKTEKTL